MLRVLSRLRSSLRSSATPKTVASFTTHRNLKRQALRFSSLKAGNAWNAHSTGLGGVANRASRSSKSVPSSLLSLEVRSSARFSSQSSWPAPTRRPTPTSRKASVSKNGYVHFGGGSGNRFGGNNSNNWYILGLSAVGIGIYTYSNLDYAPFTGRRRILGVSRRQEMAMGQQAFQMLLDDFHGRILDPRHPDSRRVRKVVSKIASTVQLIDPSLSEGFQWQAVVVDEMEANALCVPGGRILITTGLLRILPTDDDLAIVLSHEIAHALNRHGAESMHLHRIMMPIIFIANQVFDMRWIPSIFMNIFFSLPYKRTLEYEADDVGLKLCVEACYDPRVAPNVFRRLAVLQNEQAGTFMADKVAPFLSTHPQSAERANRLKAALPESLERYKDRCQPYSSFQQSWQGDGFQQGYQY